MKCYQHCHCGTDKEIQKNGLPPIWKLISSAEGSWSRCWLTFCSRCEWEPTFSEHIWKCLADFQSLLLQKLSSTAWFFLFVIFFPCFLVTVLFKQQFEAKLFFCSHFHVSFRKENISRSRLSCKERRCWVHGLSCKCRWRLWPDVLLVASFSRECAPSGRTPCHAALPQTSTSAWSHSKVNPVPQTTCP